MEDNSYSERSLELHRRLKGKIEVLSKQEVRNSDELSTVYSPGVAAPCREIQKNPEAARDLTMKGSSIAVVSDGSAVLGLGNIGPTAALPVMEGKSMLFKQFAGIDAIPLCLNTQDTDQIVQQVEALAPTFGGINLEDISAPRCFEIEERLQEIGIPVFHDDQHGTAIVVMAGIINACKVVEKAVEDLKVVINGAGAAGVAISKLLTCNTMDPSLKRPVNEIIVCDRKGIISNSRTDLDPTKQALQTLTNTQDQEGKLDEALKGADVFIGVSKGNVLDKSMVNKMAKDPVIFALSNPTPEIEPEKAKEAGASVVATGRSDYPNQVNNVLVFPAIFKAALRMKVSRISEEMKLRTAFALAEQIDHATSEHVIVEALDPDVVKGVTERLVEACSEG